MMVREKRDIRPVLFRVGVALAISLGGIIYSIFKNKSMKPSQSPPPANPSDVGNQVDSEGIKKLINDKDRALRTSSSCYSAPTTSGNQEDSSIQEEAPLDGFFSSEFDELVKEFDMAAPRANLSTEKDVEAHISFEFNEDDYEQEINSQKNMVKFLEDRVKTLEVELLKYYGLKEQETAIMELQNRVKLHNMEAKLYNLKIESLHAENRKLKAQAADYAKVISDLEAAKTTIRFLKNRLKVETEQNKEQILSLRQRVQEMQDQESEAVSGDTDIEVKMRRMKELEEEAEELRKFNHSLRVENSDLAQKLEQAQMLATSVLEDQKVEALKDETHNLRQQKEDLLKQIDQLQSSWCADIEELVYLRWINACLRYELRNYQPGFGETISRDLSKTLSPESEKKAKQLIMEYANKQGLEDRARNIINSEFDQWSFSQFSQSYRSDYGEFDDSSFDHSSANRTDTSSKRRIFSKLRRLLRGEDNNNHDSRTSSVEIGFGDSPLIVSEKGEDGNRMRRLSLGSERLKSHKTDDVKELEHRRRYSDLGFPRVYKSVVFGKEGGVGDLPEIQLNENLGSAEKSRLVKYAEVLKNPSGENSKFHRRAVSHS